MVPGFCTWVFQQGLVCRVDRNFLPVLAHTLKLDHPFDKGKECVVPAATDVVARVDLGAVLTVDDVTRFHWFTTELFTAKPLAV